VGEGLRTAALPGERQEEGREHGLVFVETQVGVPEGVPEENRHMIVHKRRIRDKSPFAEAEGSGKELATNHKQANSCAFTMQSYMHIAYDWILWQTKTRHLTCDE
jgi:hypothetical protein